MTCAGMARCTGKGCTGSGWNTAKRYGCMLIRFGFLFPVRRVLPPIIIQGSIRASSILLPGKTHPAESKRKRLSRSTGANMILPLLSGKRSRLPFYTKRKLYQNKDPWPKGLPQNAGTQTGMRGSPFPFSSIFFSLLQYCLFMESSHGFAVSRLPCLWETMPESLILSPSRHCPHCPFLLLPKRKRLSFSVCRFRSELSFPLQTQTCKKNRPGI